MSRGLRIKKLSDLPGLSAASLSLSQPQNDSLLRADTSCVKKAKGMPPKDLAGMNKTEAKYAQFLELQKQSGKIINYWFNSVALKIAELKCWYHPDFMIQNSDFTIELHEVKGAEAIFRDDAKVKCKVCASNYPYPLYIVYPKKNGWDIKPLFNYGD